MARVSFRLQQPLGGAGLRKDVTRSFADAAIASATTTLTSASAGFTDIDIGADIAVVGAGVTGADLVTTIASVTNSTTIEVADSASTTVSGAAASITADDVDGLRADSLQIAPAEALTDTFFDATSTCYGEIDLSWSLPLVTSLTEAPQPTEYVVVYSPFGSPETIPSGVVVAEGFDRFEASLGSLPDGEFAYFTLFVRYQSSGGDDYYERVAQLHEMVPRNFGSTLDMWNRVPSYYRERDSELGTLPTADKITCMGFDNYGDKVGPLLTFLSIFGFEMDRARSIIAHVARAKDPQYADPESLAALAEEFGSVIDIEDLGTPRLRSLFNNIGIFRRIKGTEVGTEFFIKSLTSNNASVDTAARVLNVANGRVNYALDPQNTKSFIDIETTVGDEFGEAESALHHDESFVSSFKYPASMELRLGQFAVAVPGFESVGTASLPAPGYTGVTESTTSPYTSTADPDVTIPAGHMFAINNDSSIGANYVSWSIAGTEFDLANKGGAVVCGAVCSVTDASPAATTSVFRVGTNGNNAHIAIGNNTSGELTLTFRTSDGVVTTATSYAPTLDTLLYAVGYVNTDWSELTFKVFDSTGEVHSSTVVTSAHAGVWEPGVIYLCDHAGGGEMAHCSTGTHATKTWGLASSIANEWISGSRTPSGGTIYSLESPVFATIGDVVSFSVHSGSGVLGNIAWARLVDQTTGVDVYGYQDVPSIRNGVPYFDIETTEASAYSNIEFLVYDNTSFDNSYYLIEKNYAGDYFDGSLVRGGWLIDSTSISDYRWEGGAAQAHKARSLYSEDYERTRQILNGLYRSVLPVDVAPTYVLWYNILSGTPGVGLGFAPLGTAPLGE